MGTNFYGRIIPTEEDKNHAARLALDGEFDRLKQMMDEHQPVHIGKQSAGWRFCWHRGFHPDAARFRTNPLGMMRSKLSRYRITDEYGQEYTTSEFFDRISPTVGKASIKTGVDEIVDGVWFLNADFS